jgi:hypothetical protein
VRQAEDSPLLAMRKIPCGKGKQFFLPSQSLSLDRFRLQAIGLRTLQGNLTYSRGRKKESTAKFGGTENWKKFLQEGKHSTKLKTPLNLKKNTPYCIVKRSVVYSFSFKGLNRRCTYW